MRLGNRPARDPRESALADIYRSRMDNPADPRMAALEDLSDPLGEPDSDADDYAMNGEMDEDPSDYLSDPRGDRTPIGPNGIAEDAVAMPGSGQMPIDDLEAQGLLTPDLLRKARPSVWQSEEGMNPDQREFEIWRARNTPGNGAPPASLPPFQRIPFYGEHTGPAMDRYHNLDRSLEEGAVRRNSDEPLPGDMDRLRGAYDEASREAALKGHRLPALFRGR